MTPSITAWPPTIRSRSFALTVFTLYSNDPTKAFKAFDVSESSPLKTLTPAFVSGRSAFDARVATGGFRRRLDSGFRANVALNSRPMLW